MLSSSNSELLPEEELPLPSFVEVFGDGGMGNALLKKRKKNSGNMGKLDAMNGEETTGRWTPDEHRLFLEGIMLYGKDWKKMQPLIKTRTLVQIRTHAQKVFKKIGLKKMNGLKRKDPAEKEAGATDSGRSGDKGSLATMNEMEDGDDLDELDDEELEHIGLSVSGVDESMLAAMSAEQQQQLAMQQQAVHSHFVQMGANEAGYQEQGHGQGQGQQVPQQQWAHEQQQLQQPPQAMAFDSYQVQQQQSTPTAAQSLQGNSTGSTNGAAEYSQQSQTQPTLASGTLLPSGSTGMHMSDTAVTSSEVSGGSSGGLLSSLSSGVPQSQPLAITLPPSSTLQHQTPSSQTQPPPQQVQQQTSQPQSHPQP